MILKDYLRKHSIRMTTLQQDTGIPYSTINDIINERTDINKSSVENFIKLAKALNLSADDFYLLLKNEIPVLKIDDQYSVYTDNRNYYIYSSDKRDFLCINNEINTYYLKDIANTYINNEKRQERLDSWTELI